MTKFFFKFKKTCFWPISPLFGAKKVFSKKLGCNAQLCQNSEESNDPIPRKTPTQISGGRDGKTLFDMVLPATARGLTNRIAVDCYLKVIYRVCWSNQKLHFNFHSGISIITTSCCNVFLMQNIIKTR